jgi:hypothetical protein
MNEQQYNLINPYKPILALFVKTGEYVGGADNLIPIYEREFSTTVNGRCPSCFGAMLLDCWSKINEYERNM